MFLKNILTQKMVSMKKKEFSEFRAFIRKPSITDEDMDGKSYRFRVYSKQLSDDRIAVMVECSRNLPLLRCFGRAVYLLVTDKGQISETTKIAF